MCVYVLRLRRLLQDLPGLCLELLSLVDRLDSLFDLGRNTAAIPLASGGFHARDFHAVRIRTHELRCWRPILQGLRAIASIQYASLLAILLLNRCPRRHATVLTGILLTSSTFTFVKRSESGLRTYLLCPSQTAAITQISITTRASSPLWSYPGMAIRAVLLQMPSSIPPFPFLLARE